jgi:hypothetical protein
MTNTTTQATVSPTSATDGALDWGAQHLYIEPGTRVYCDGQYGHARPYRQVGVRWDRVSYVFATPSIFPGRVRTDIMHRSQLTIVR